MNFFHRLSFSTCIVAIPLLSSCTVSKPVSAEFSATSAPSGKFEVVAHEKVKQDSVRTVLGFNEWPFELKASPADKYVTSTVEFQQKGQPVRILARSTIFTNATSHQKVNIGIMPVVTTMAGKDGWKLLFQTEEGASLMTVGNPLKGKMSSVKGGVPKELGENSFLLMTAHNLEDRTPSSLAAEATYKIVVKFVPSQKEWDPAQPLEYESPINAGWLNNS